MRLHKILHIFKKEVLDTLRDRRTILLMVVVPVLLYPGLMIFINELAVSQQAKLEQKVVKIALVNVPSDSPLIQRIRTTERMMIVSTQKPFDDVRTGAINFVIEMESKFADQLNDNRTATIRLHYDRSNDDSTTNLDRVKDILDAYNKQVLDQRLEEKSIDEAYVKPIEIDEVNVASKQRMGGFIIGRFLPMMMVLMVLAGSMYPAIDMTAGEKERGTLETILTSPATRTEIVLGKFITVTLIALITGLLNLGSMSATFAFGILKGASTLFQIKIPFHYLMIMVACLLPLAVFFSGMMMAVSSFARSFKEAQNMLTPIYMLGMMPAMVSFIPGIQLEGFWLTMPVANVTLLFKELMLGVWDINHILIVFFCVVFLASAALFLAIHLFGREEVLFGEVSSFGLSFRRSNIVPKPVPDQPEALFFTMLSLTLLLYVAIPLQSREIISGLAITELGIFLGFPLAFAAYLKLDFVQTFRLRAPSLRFLLIVLLFFAGAELCAGTLVYWQDRLFPIPKQLVEVMDKLLTVNADHPFWLILTVTAILPAICEEVTFRGVVLSGLLTRMKPAGAMLITAALFAVFHLSFHRFLPVFLLGWAASYLVWKSGSIFTGMLFHLLNNGLAGVMINHPSLDRFELMQMKPSLVHSAIGLGFIAVAIYLCQKSETAKG